jgi:hypothetical protein
LSRDTQVFKHLDIVMTKLTLPRIFWLIAGLVLGLEAFVAWRVPPSLFTDPAAGWQVWQAWRGGAPFNCVWMPDSHDLTHDVAVFQAWWSPGQYLVPGLLTLMGLSLGRAIVVIGVVGNILGLTGYWRLWKTWGVTPELAAGAGVVSVLVRPFGAMFGMANVAEELMFAAVPWIALLVWRWRALKFWQCAGLVTVLAFGVGLKFTFLTTALAMLAGVCLHEVWESGGSDKRRLAMLMTKALAIFLAVKFIWDWGYLRRGASIGAAHALEFNNISSFTLPWGGPLLSALGGENLLGRIFLHPAHPLMADEAGFWPFFVLAGLATAVLMVWMWRHFMPRAYSVQVMAWLAVYGAIFSWLYARGAPVSFDERHFRAAGLLLLPVLLAWIINVRGWGWRLALFGLLGAFCAYGQMSFVVNARLRARLNAAGRLGFSQIELTRDALVELHRIDDEKGRHTLFYVTKPQIAIEVARSRVVCIPVDDWSAEQVKNSVFAGRTDRLILVLPAAYGDNGKGELVRGEFPDYRQWTSHTVGDFLFIEGR